MFFCPLDPSSLTTIQSDYFKDRHSLIGLDTAAMRSTFLVEDGDAIPQLIYVDSLVVVFQKSTIETHFLEHKPPAVLAHRLL